MGTTEKIWKELEGGNAKPLDHKDFGKFWQEKRLWSNGLNFLLCKTKENLKKPPKTLFCLVFPYLFDIFYYFF